MILKGLSLNSLCLLFRDLPGQPLKQTGPCDSKQDMERWGMSGIRPVSLKTVCGSCILATFMNNADVDEKTITSQIGHHDIAFTRKQYMNAKMRQMKRSMDKLGDYMENIQ